MPRLECVQTTDTNERNLRTQHTRPCPCAVEKQDLTEYVEEHRGSDILPHVSHVVQTVRSRQPHRQPGPLPVLDCIPTHLCGVRKADYLAPFRDDRYHRMFDLKDRLDVSTRVAERSRFPLHR